MSKLSGSNHSYPKLFITGEIQYVQYQMVNWTDNLSFYISIIAIYRRTLDTDTLCKFQDVYVACMTDWSDEKVEGPGCERPLSLVPDAAVTSYLL